MRILIFGGTGTLGEALVKHYNQDPNNEIMVFSRDEYKQKLLKDKYPHVKTEICDITNISNFHCNADVCYHVAALKHIDVVENNIDSAIKTNILGTINVANYALKAGIKYCAFSSTDKAVYPINVYGHTKAISERYLLHLNELNLGANFRIFRWGNVINSRGSVVSTFVKTLKEQNKIYITDPEMTRFWIKIEDAVNFMVQETENPTSAHEIQIPEMKSAYVLDLADIIAKKLGIKHYDIQTIGLRPGEKIHEDITPTLNSKNSAKYTKSELSKLLGDIN